MPDSKTIATLGEKIAIAMMAQPRHLASGADSDLDMRQLAVRLTRLPRSPRAQRLACSSGATEVRYPDPDPDPGPRLPSHRHLRGPHLLRPSALLCPDTPPGCTPRPAGTHRHRRESLEPAMCTLNERGREIRAERLKLRVSGRTLSRRAEVAGT
eukprot:2722621-Rhodomonas_salina.2